uniref:Uncharacterized protein n=1 Tax=Rhizophora mucronata TaxID=61149 RepID=A0A2P2PR12_RHIMU
MHAIDLKKFLYNSLQIYNTIHALTTLTFPVLAHISAA